MFQIILSSTLMCVTMDENAQNWISDFKWSTLEALGCPSDVFSTATDVIPTKTL